MSETKRLGRGLEALLGPVSREQAEASGALRELPVASVLPNPYQPRTHMDEAALAELTASIEASGLLQPVVVRPRNGRYELIAGERRWRAVQRLGWTKIPAVVKDVDDQTLLTLALIENLQRNDLSAIDEAPGYQRLGSEFAAAAGRDRAPGRTQTAPPSPTCFACSSFPTKCKQLVQEGKLSEGHARALLALDRRRSDAVGSPGRRSSRAGRCARSRRGLAGETAGRAPRRRRRRSSARRPRRKCRRDVRRVEDALRKRLGTDVRVHPRRRGRGFLSISYYSNDDLAGSSS